MPHLTSFPCTTSWASSPTTIHTTGRGLRYLLQRQGLLRYFNYMLFSDEIGASKPEPEVFRRAALGLGAAPFQIVHIGDRESNDVIGPPVDRHERHPLHRSKRPRQRRHAGQLPSAAHTPRCPPSSAASRPQSGPSNSVRHRGAIIAPGIRSPGRPLRRALSPAPARTPHRRPREAEFPVVDQAGRAADIDRLWPLLLGNEDAAENGKRGSLSPHAYSLSPLKVKRDAVNTDLIVGLDGAAYSYALEVGRGTIELNVGPYATLFELESAFRTALQRLVRAAANWTGACWGTGVQPLSPPTRALLSPKQRYHALADIMGADWVWYTVTRQRPDPR